MTKTLTELVESVVDTHQRFYKKDPKGEIFPSILIETTGESEVIGIPWRNANERAIILALLRKRLAEPDALRYVIWSESWMVRAESAEAGEAAKRFAATHTLAQHPDRVEMIATIGVDRRLPTPVAVSMEIIRGRSGGVRLLKRMPDADHMDGALATLFPQPTKHHA